MATAYDEEAGESAFTEETEVEEGVTLLDAMRAPNLVPMLGETDVGRIGSDALREYEIDFESCKDFRDRYDRAMDSAMQVRKAKTYPWPNASNVNFPLLTQACVQFQARALPAIIDGGNVVKGRVMGDDPDGAKAAQADRIGAFMTWQFLNDVPGWEEDTDRLLLALPIVGCMFRKTWRDPLLGCNNSETIFAKDFVVNAETVSLDKAPRFTHVQRYYPHEIEGFIRTGIWAKVAYHGDDGSDPHALVTIYEQYRLIDMDDDGLPEPYVVTFTEDGAVCRVVADFGPDDVYLVGPMLNGQIALADIMQAGAGAMPFANGVQVARIARRQTFTKYGFIPSPDGSFYDIGFGTLTDSLTAAINTLINQLIDAGTLGNMQGGFIGGGTKIKGGNMRFAPGEWKRVEGVTAGPLKDNILPLQLPGPSPVLFQLLGMLTEAVQQITSVSDILSGNQDSQTAPTTALALIEQGQKVFTAIYQRIHRSLGNEIRIMARLDRDYLDERKYFALDDNPQVVGREDFQDRDLDVVPVSDPRAINDRVKMAKAQVLMSHNGDPLINQVEIRKREFEAAGIENIPPLFNVPAPAPAPDAMAKAAESLATVRNKDAQTAKTLIEAATAAYALGQTLGDAAITQEAQAMLGEAIKLADSVRAQMNGGDDGGQSPDGQGPVPEVGGEPADAGVPAIPAGPGGGGDQALGLGTGELGSDAAGPDAGGDMGGPGQPVVQ